MEPDTFGRAALIVVDMQNDFVRRGAPLEVPDARVTIEPHCALLSAFRARNWTVVYTRFLSRTEPCLLWNWSPQCRPPTKCCWKVESRMGAVAWAFGHRPVSHPRSSVGSRTGAPV
jgi:nicotinamidase-related amidase